MKKYCLALDLKEDENGVKEYIKYHQHVWPEILETIKDAGIVQMEIYQFGLRLFMVMETKDDFSFEQKKKTDEVNSKVLEWETLMWKYQQAVPGSKSGEKWVLMEKIFDLKETG